MIFDTYMPRHERKVSLTFTLRSLSDDLPEGVPLIEQLTDALPREWWDDSSGADWWIDDLAVNYSGRAVPLTEIMADGFYLDLEIEYEIEYGKVPRSTLVDAIRGALADLAQSDEVRGMGWAVHKVDVVGWEKGQVHGT